MTNHKNITPGRIFIATSGEYSDFGIDGMFVALHEFCPHHEVSEYMKAEPDEYNRYGFIGFLCSKGLVADVCFSEIHTGSYGDIRYGDFDGDEFRDC